MYQKNISETLLILKPYSQGGVHHPSFISGRTMVSTWWLFCTVIVGTYCGNLVAFLTVTKVTMPFQTLQGLVDLKGTYKWGILGQTAHENSFMVRNLRVGSSVHM